MLLTADSDSQSALSGRMALRAMTAADHARVDAAYSAFALSEPEGYAGFLRAQAAAFLPVEAALEEAGAAKVLSDWPQRRRGHLLKADLAALDLTAPPGAGAPSLRSAAAVLGAVYVLEGSRLGGQMLARSVPGHFPRRFLTSGDPGLWRRLVQALDASLHSPAMLAEAAMAARQVFGRFAQSAAVAEGAASVV